MSEKRKCSEEHKIFQEKWEELHFVCNSNDKVQCLICCVIFFNDKDKFAFRTRLTDEHLHAVLRIQINIKSGQALILS